MPFNALTNQMEPNYEEKISLLSAEDFFALFESLDADPYWVTSNGMGGILTHFNGLGTACISSIQTEILRNAAHRLLDEK